MSAAVDRLLDERERQGFPRHVEDVAALATVAAVMSTTKATERPRREKAVRA